MANRYWVGGSANWDGTAGTKWSLTDGGAGGQAVPTSSDDVFFTATSGAVTVTLADGNVATCKSLTCTGFTGTITETGSGAGSANIYGSLVLSSTMSFLPSGTITFKAATSGHTITTAGKTLLCRIVFHDDSNNNTGAWTLQDDLSCTHINGISNENGILNTNGKTLTIQSFSAFLSNGQTVNLGASVVNIYGSGAEPWAFSSSNTLTTSGSSINITSTRDNSFTVLLGGATYGNMSIIANDVTIRDSGGFSQLILGAGMLATFQSSRTYTISDNFIVQSSEYDRTILDSTSGSAFTLTKSSGTITVTGCEIYNSTATGGAVWVALSSIDGGGNSGWVFSSAEKPQVFSGLSASTNVKPQVSSAQAGSSTKPSAR